MVPFSPRGVGPCSGMLFPSLPPSASWHGYLLLLYFCLWLQCSPARLALTRYGSVLFSMTHPFPCQLSPAEMIPYFHSYSHPSAPVACKLPEDKDQLCLALRSPVQCLTRGRIGKYLLDAWMPAPGSGVSDRPALLPPGAVLLPQGCECQVEAWGNHLDRHPAPPPCDIRDCRR